MTKDEILPIVAQMRQAQKDYFKTRSFKKLEEARRLEQMVDAIIKSEMAGDQLPL